MAVREVHLEDGQFTLISKAVSDPKRFEMLQRIGQAKEAPTCSCLGEWLELAPATISHQLKELENAGLVDIQRNGKFANITLRRDTWKAYLKKLSTL
jgi:ArsR family transcriptional regulator